MIMFLTTAAAAIKAATLLKVAKIAIAAAPACIAVDHYIKEKKARAKE